MLRTLVVIALLVTLGVLAAGIVAMTRGGEFNRNGAVEALCRKTEVGPAHTRHTETYMHMFERGAGGANVGPESHHPAAIVEGGGAQVAVLLESHHVSIVRVAIDASVDNASLKEKVSGPR